RLQLLDDLHARARRRPRRERGLHLVDAIAARAEGGERRVGDPDELGESRPLLVGPDRDRHPTVADRRAAGPGLVETWERAARYRTRRAVAVTGSDDAVDDVVDDPGRERVQRGFDLRHVEIAPSTRALAVDEPRGQRGGDEARRQGVGDRGGGADGLAVGVAREPVEPAERGALAAEARVVLVRTSVAVETRADHDEV